MINKENEKMERKKTSKVKRTKQVTKKANSKKEELKLGVRELSINDKSATIILSNVRCAFVNIASPNIKFSEKDNDGNAISGSYELTCLIPKKEEKFMAVLDKILQQVLKNSSILKTSAEKNKAYKTALNIGEHGALIKDGDNSKNKDGAVYDGLENHYTIKAKSKAIRKNGGFMPKIEFKIVDRFKNRVPEHLIADEIYSGAWFDIALNLKPYSSQMGTGISAYIAGIMKLKDDTRLGGMDPFEVRDDITEDNAFGPGFKGNNESEEVEF